MALTGLLILSSGFFLMTIASIPAISHRVRGSFYGWKLVGLTMVVNALAAGPVWSGVGVWVKALEINFGWSRTQLTGAFSLTQLEGSILGPGMGYLIDRLGPRRMIFMGFVVIGLGFLVFSRTTNLPMFYLSYVIIMTGISAGTWLPCMATISRWFYHKRSTAMAVAGEGSPIGGLVLIPLLAWAVTPGHLGWSTTALWTGVLFLAVAWPISQFIRDRPEDYGQYPDGNPQPGPPQSGPEEQQSVDDDSVDRRTLEADRPDYTAREALRTGAFWFITFGHALSSMLIATLTVHLVPMLTDQGLSLQTASYMFSVMMGVQVVFQLIGGYLGDRFPKNLVLFGFTSVQAVGFTLAAFVHTIPMAILFAVLYGAGHGGRVPITTAIRGDYFGNKAFATITGISMAPLYAFMLAAPLLAATMFDARGDYELPFLILGGLGSLSGVCFLFAKRPESVVSPRGFGVARSQA